MMRKREEGYWAVSMCDGCGRLIDETYEYLHDDCDPQTESEIKVVPKSRDTAEQLGMDMQE